MFSSSSRDAYPIPTYKQQGNGIKNGQPAPLPSDAADYYYQQKYMSADYMEGEQESGEFLHPEKYLRQPVWRENPFKYFGSNFLATLVALHLTPVSKSVSRWVVVSD